MNISTIGELKLFFESFKQKTFDGVAAFTKVDSEIPGPVLGITACTNGNEPSGLAVIKYLLEDLNIQSSLLRGTLYLGVNNVLAVERYFAAASESDKKSARFFELNMNRLPKNLLKRQNDLRYEIQRAKALRDIWKRFTVGFDIHSTSQDTRPMIISGGGNFHKELVRGFPVSTVLSNIDVVQIGLPAFGFYGEESRIPVFEIEAGAHEKPESFSRAITCAVALLQNLEMYPGQPSEIVCKYDEYFIAESIVFPDISYELVRIFPDFEFVSEGTLFARGNHGDIVAPFDCHTIFCGTGTKPQSIAEEVLFLSAPVRQLRND